MKRCDIVIISCDQLEYTKGCIASIERHTRYPHKIIIVDNASNEETLTWLTATAAEGRIILIANKANEGWVKAVNQGIDSSDADYICVMNNDTVVYPGWLEEMVSAAEHDAKVGMVNPRWQLPKRYFLGRTVYFNTVIRALKGRSIEADWARGFCYLITRELIRRIGGLDMAFSPAYYDDVDYSIRASRAGFVVMRAEGAFVWHYKNITYDVTLGGHANQVSLLSQKAALFHERWGYPLRILIIGTLPLKDSVRAAGIRDLLHDQNIVTMVHHGKPTGLRHTNFCERRVLPFLQYVTAVRILLNNRRHGMKKRFDLVVCPTEISAKLSAMKLIGGFFTFFAVKDECCMQELVKNAQHMKYEKKGR